MVGSSLAVVRVDPSDLPSQGTGSHTLVTEPMDLSPLVQDSASNPAMSPGSVQTFPWRLSPRSSRHLRSPEKDPNEI